MNIHRASTAFAAAVLTLAALWAPVSARPHITLPGHVGGPGTTTPQYIMDLESASSALRKLDQDSRVLYDHQDKLIDRVYDLKTNLQTTADRLGMLTTLDEDLKKLEAAVNAVYTAAETAEAIPQAREKAKKIKASMATAKANVTAARKRMDAIVAKTEPIRKKLASAAEKAGKVETALTLVNDGPIVNMRFPIAIAAGCVKKIPAPKHDCAVKNTDDTALKVDAVVLEYDRVVQLLLTNPQPWLPSVSFLDPFNANLNVVDKLRADMEALLKRLNTLASQLGKLNDVLDRSFSFSFPYPDPTLENPVRISHYEVKIGFRTIINGANAIEDAIEKALSKTLWTVLKGLGVSKYVHELQDKANSAVDELLRAVNFNVDVNLPSLAALDKLEALLPSLDAQLDGLKFPEINLDTPAFGFPNVKPGVDFRDIKASASFFNPSGLMPGKGDLCKGVTFGCN